MAPENRATPVPGLPLRRAAGRLLLAGLLGLTPLLAAAEALLQRPELRLFIDEMVGKHGFNSADLAQLFGQVQTHQKIIDAITRPAEAKPWHAYRKIFLTEARIAGGVRFWDEHRELLDAAEERFGVPPEVIVAIIGVETNYGRNAGSYPVIDALTTLAFDYPRRGDFFRSELEQFLLLTRDEGFDPLQPVGSYAGAMGLGQFIPSSYRRYAIDFDGDGQRDLFGNRADAIGSVANYFSVHGWRRGEAVIAPTQVAGDDYRALVELGYKPQRRLERFPGYGVAVPDGLDGERLAALIELETETGPAHWIVLDNFYVITRYNHSPLYAMAVHQLSQAVVERRANGDVNARG
jgi:membrane-bound lytic murein transglycosylase B